MTRTAISPRLAIRTFENTLKLSPVGRCRANFEVDKSRLTGLRVVQWGRNPHCVQNCTRDYTSGPMSVTSPKIDGLIPSGETGDPPTKKAPFRTDIEELRERPQSLHAERSLRI